MHKHEKGIAAGNLTGAVQVLRRQDCKEDTLTCTLQGLTPDAAYDVTNADTGEVTRMPANERGNADLGITLSTAPAAGMLSYTATAK